MSDIEHVDVHDDPRKWSKARKRFTLAVVSCASLLLTLAVSIYNPAINNIIADLHTTYEQVSWTLSTHALVTGCTPLIWGHLLNCMDERIKLKLFIIGCAVAGDAKSIGVLIAMRVIQGIGGSAVLTIGAATLADIYDPKERGSVMGLYYAAPLLGPALGPLIGGVATKLFSWRATFYFLAIFGGVSLLAFVFFKDTFRRERSLSYQAAVKQTMQKRLASLEDSEPSLNANTEKIDSIDKQDPEIQNVPDFQEVKIGLRQMPMLRPIILVLRRPNNLCVLLASGLIYGGISYCLAYTVVRTFGAPPYNYGSLELGLVLLSFGVGNMFGSLLGGRWSDYTRRKYQEKHDGISKSEHRLHSTKIMMPVLPAGLIAYAWMAEKKVNIGPICVALFFIGFSAIWIYSSILAYIVDANAGRSSSAVSVNSFFREVAVPLQNALGDGGLYTLMAGLMLGSEWRERAEERERKANA
ncbi:MFS general substrate transporter [Flammula alnicola]|nr:MFS general substrate transporter [Flammula alnicola]